MTLFLLVLFFSLCIGLAYKGLTNKGMNIYEPWIPMAAVFAGFIGIQLMGLANHPRSLPVGALDKTIFMAILCLSGFWLGYSRKTKRLHFISGHFSLSRLLLISLGLTLFGAYFFYLLNRLPKELTSATNWTGLPVAYLFFAQTVSYGFALSCLIFFRYGDRIALLIAGLGSLFYLDAIIVAGRRAVTAEFFFIVILAMFFGKGWRLPRWLMTSAMIVMVLMLYSTQDYRVLAKEKGWDAPLYASNIDFFDNLENVIQYGGSEVRNAVYTIEAYDRTLDFDFGLTNWNEIVFNYVPAQIVGRNIKERMMVRLPNVAWQVFKYRPNIGTTETGLADAFGSFWYFGFLKFFIIGLILRKIWNAARNGSVTSQLLYMLLIVKAMHALTHHTNWFFSPWVHMTIFLFPLLFWARISKFVKKVERLPKKINLHWNVGNRTGSDPVYEK
jgi:hypothetical protein